MMGNLKLAEIQSKWLRRILIVALTVFVIVLVPIMFLLSLAIFIGATVLNDFPYYWEEFREWSMDIINSTKTAIKNYWK